MFLALQESFACRYSPIKKKNLYKMHLENVECYVECIWKLYGMFTMKKDVFFH